MLSKGFLREFSSIMSFQFLLMIVIVAFILIFYDSKNLEKQGATKDSKLAKYCGVMYLIFGISLFVVAKLV